MGNEDELPGYECWSQFRWKQENGRELASCNAAQCVMDHTRICPSVGVHRIHNFQIRPSPDTVGSGFFVTE